LLDLQRVAQARGYKAQGFWLEPQYLGEFAGPVIVFIEPRGLQAFRRPARGQRRSRLSRRSPPQPNPRNESGRFHPAPAGGAAPGGQGAARSFPAGGSGDRPGWRLRVTLAAAVRSSGATI
jgi:hypothetical protein